MNLSTNNGKSILQLNLLLSAELAAVESYRQALEQLDSTLYYGTLLQCRHSHEERAERLREEIIARGGEPVLEAHVWRTLSRFSEFQSVLFGDTATISALIDGEKEGQNDYQHALAELDAHARELVESAILPDQQHTHHALWDIKRQLAA
ncbi:MAG TPA: DUF2383 domain-containing protein [Polyangiaceae bacterium]|nr:DUF2383 domain-containing protein [Polyangiaceae bacterium]